MNAGETVTIRGKTYVAQIMGNHGCSACVARPPSSGLCSELPPCWVGRFGNGNVNWQALTFKEVDT